MKSIEKLRGWLDYKINHYDHEGNAIVLNTGTDPNELYDLADEIEREIAEKYMELPVDADGVPIRCGDVVAWLNGAPSSKFTIDTFVFDMEYGEWDVKDSNFLNVFPAHRCRHVKPRTIEDVLREFGDWYKHVAGGCDEPGIIAEYADELRGMGVSE